MGTNYCKAGISFPLENAGAVGALWNPYQSGRQKEQSSSAACVTSLLVTCPAQSGDVTVCGVGLQDRKNLLRAPVIFTDFLLPSLVTKGVTAKPLECRKCLGLEFC